MYLWYRFIDSLRIRKYRKRMKSQKISLSWLNTKRISIIMGSQLFLISVCFAPESSLNLPKYLNQLPPVAKLIYIIAEENNMDPELMLALVDVESRFIITAQSEQGAYGLTQLMPIHGINRKFLISNIYLGTLFLKSLLNRYSITEALCYYNFGRNFQDNCLYSVKVLSKYFEYKEMKDVLS